MLTREHYTTALDMWGGMFVQLFGPLCPHPHYLFPQSAGCIFAEMLNRLRNIVTRTLTNEQTGQVQPFYAIFPADHHLNHLEIIIQTLGPPSRDVINSTTNERIRNFIITKVYCVVCAPYIPIFSHSSPLDRRFGRKLHYATSIHG